MAIRNSEAHDRSTIEGYPPTIFFAADTGPLGPLDASELNALVEDTLNRLRSIFDAFTYVAFD